jgi:hypothetical protein
MDREAVLLMADHERIAADLHDHVIQERFATGWGCRSWWLGRDLRSQLMSVLDDERPALGMSAQIDFPSHLTSATTCSPSR